MLPDYDFRAHTAPVCRVATGPLKRWLMWVEDCPLDLVPSLKIHVLSSYKSRPTRSQQYIIGMHSRALVVSTLPNRHERESAPSIVRLAAAQHPRGA